MGQKPKGYRNLEFDGASFSDVYGSVRSMLGLGDWMAVTVPLSEKMPNISADLSVFVPVLGIGLHNGGLTGATICGY